MCSLPFVLIFMFAFGFASLSIAGAAEITAPKGTSCDLSLRGEIVSGDVKRLSAALRGISKHKKRLCLHSPTGGNLSEGILIIKWLIEESNITTVVDQGDECVSACALVFMFGNHNEGDNLTGPDRELHYLGKLGFHTPHINPPIDSNSREFSARAYRAGIKAIGLLLEIDLKDWFPKSLLVEALKKEPEEFLYVDTVGKAAGWEISLIGFKPPAEITLAMLEHACLNSTKQDRNRWMGRWWGAGDSPTGMREDVKSPNRKVPLTTKHYRGVIKEFGSENSYICVADIYDAGKRGLVLDVNFGSSVTDPEIPKPKTPDSVSKGEIFPGTPIWYLFRGDTKLSVTGK